MENVIMLSKEEYKKLKNRYALTTYKIKEEYNIVEDYDYSPDKSLSIIVKKGKKNAFIYNESFKEWVCILNTEKDEEYEKKFNYNYFQFFRWTFNDEWKEYEEKR